ncbi:MAG: hypothetical protein RL532_1181, partial [Actinomycetota bacterium]
FHLAPLGFCQQPGGEGVFIDHHVFIDILPAVDHISGLKPFVV